MLNKRSALLVIALLVPLMLAACGGGPDADDIENALQKAYNEGEVDDMNDLLCDSEEQLSADDLETEAGEVSLDSVDCSVDDDRFSCNLAFTFEGADQPIELSMAGDIEDGKLCNIQDPTAGGGE